MISTFFRWIFKVLFFPFFLVWWVLSAPARKIRKQRELEKWGYCYEVNRIRLENQEYFDEYSHLPYEKAKIQHKKDFCKALVETENYYRNKDKKQMKKGR